MLSLPKPRVLTLEYFGNIGTRDASAPLLPDVLFIYCPLTLSWKLCRSGSRNNKAATSNHRVNSRPRMAVAKVHDGKKPSLWFARFVGSCWSVQAELFLQLPLGPVGTGKVWLMSVGAAFSVKHGLLRKL